MAVVQAYQLDEGRRFDDNDRGTEFTERWVVELDERLDTPLTVANTAELPMYGDEHPQEAGYCLASKSGGDQAGPLAWHVDLTWSNRYGGEGLVLPWLAPPALAIRYHRVYETAFADLDGKPLTNTVGGFLDPAPQRVRRLTELTVTVVQQTYDRLAGDDWIDRVNSDAWNGYEPNAVLLDNIVPRRQYDPKLYPLFSPYYWVVDYAFLVDPTLWIPLRWYNLGFRAMVNDELQVLRDAEGYPYNEPVGLREDGTQVAVYELPYELTFRMNDMRAFSALNLVF